MALPDIDTSVGHSFGLEFDGVVVKQITDVSGLQIDRDSDGTLPARNLPGRLKAGEVTLTRGPRRGQQLPEVVPGLAVREGPDARKGGAIIVYDDEGAAIKRHRLSNARLKTLERGTARPMTPTPPTDRLILAREGSKTE